MSQKITAKNLQYNSNLPPFLARLRGQNAADRDPNAPDPILAARRRPGKKRSGSAEAEDAPLVVDEHGHAVEDVTVGADGAVREKAAVGTAQDTQQPADAADSQVAPPSASAEKLAGIGEQRKRKVAKVIGADADDGDEDHKGQGDKESKSRKNTGGAAAKDEKDKDTVTAASAKAKQKKKAKKIKLSFGEDEG